MPLLSLRSLAVAGAALVVVLSCGPDTRASSPVTLTAADAEPFANLGRAVAIDGDTAIVGADLHDGPGGVDQGAAYIFRWSGSGWTEEAMLAASDGGAGDQFGYTVAIDGDTVVIGAWLHDGAPGAESGAAYIFTRTGSTWTQRAKLVASDGASGDRLGFSVAIDGDTALIGAPNDDNALGNIAGAAYAFTRDGGVWTQQAKLTGADGAAADQFGGAVAINGDTAVIGARFDDDAGSSSGSGYVFVRSGSVWTQQAKLTALDAASDDRFGAAVAVDGDTAILGASFDDHATGVNQGAAYIFVRTGAAWSQEARLVAADAASSDSFGAAVALDGDSAIIGAPLDNGAQGADQGGAYVFTRTGSTWTQQAKLVVPTGAAGDQLGFAVALDGDDAIVGGPLVGADDAGAAVVFERAGSRWIGAPQRLLASNGQGGDAFGSVVAIDGDTAIVGARSAGAQNGAAYAFTRVGGAWAQEWIFTVPDNTANDFFGAAVAIDGDTAIIGASQNAGATTQTGSAYVFVRSGSSWVQQAKLFASDGATLDRFGYAVAIDGDTAIVGALNSSLPGATAAGAAYIFVRSGSAWTQQAKLVASDGAAVDSFGVAVALAGDTAIVGAYLHDGGAGANSGAVYTFTRSGSSWTQRSKLTPSGSASGDQFGVALAVSGDTLVVGADRVDIGPTTDQGAAYIFTRSGAAWTQQARLTASDGDLGDMLGASAAIEGDTVIVGAPFDDGALGAEQGSAYVFTRAGSAWVERAKHTDPDGAATDYFGWSVAVDGDTAIAGAISDDDGALTGRGSARVFHVGEEHLSALVRNTTTGAIGASLADAINNASPTNFLVATAPAFWETTPTDYLTKALSISSASRIRQPHDNAITLANGASLNAQPGRDMLLYGQTDLPAGAGATLRAGALRVGVSADLNLFSNATLSAQVAGARVDGWLTMFPGASLFLSGDLQVDGHVTLATGALAADSLTINRGGRFIGDGDLFTSVGNRDDFITIDDTLISGDLTNHAGATVTVQIGTLTLLGSLTNNGTIVGDLQTLLRGQQTQPGDGFSVGGDYAAGPDASLLMSSDLWRITIVGDFDVAINDNTRYDMAQATLRIGAGAPSTIERMSTDIGPSPDGLDRTIAGHYPIGTLRITGNVANLIDTHDNDNLGQTACEAIYVRTLIIDAGATLNTNGCPVYYETLTNNGSVDDPANLIQIAQCAADLTGDGQVDGADLGLLLGSWGGAQGDLTGDGFTDGADLGLLLGAWGACP
jgi:hypothetical protein